MENDRPSVIRVDHVTKVFKLPHEKTTSIKGAVLNFYRKRKSYELLQALDNVTFEIQKGDFFGIVGRNGSGKSTLLKVLAEIYPPTTGSVAVDGSLTPFIELGVGFNPELTGRENIYMNGALLGFSRKEMKGKYQEIVDFAELEEFMDQKLKNYSSGMQVRLAFSIAIQSQSEILLFDEVLAVGDANFQKKCYDVFKNIRSEGKTVILVTHDMSAVQEYCNKALLLDKGKIIFQGDTGKVVKRYNDLNLELIDKQVDASVHKRDKANQPKHAIEISDIWMEKNGKHTKTFTPKDDLEVVINFKVNRAVQDPVVGITLKDQVGRPIFATNTKAEHIVTGSFKPNQSFTTSFSIENIYSDGNYYIIPAVTSTDTATVYDTLENGFLFTVGGWDYPAFVTQPKRSIKLTRN